MEIYIAMTIISFLGFIVVTIYLILNGDFGKKSTRDALEQVAKEVGQDEINYYDMIGKATVFPDFTSKKHSENLSLLNQAVVELIDKNEKKKK